MVETGLNAVETSSGGRLFDGVASLIGVAPERVSFDGQAAMALECAAQDGPGEYRFELQKNGDLLELDWKPVVLEILRDLRAGVEPGLISTRFHRAVADAMLQVAGQLGHGRLFLSGGCFQNRLLMRTLVDRARSVKLYWHQLVPPNDGGLSLGQALVAAEVFERGETHETG